LNSIIFVDTILVPQLTSS